MAVVKRVVIIGAGASGLAAIKCCLDEGFEPTCLERTDYIGGLWHYTPEIEENQACVMKSTVINTSKEMMCYSDFPIPRDYSTFMHNTYVEKYFHLYAEKFNLNKYIQFKTEVINVKKADDYQSTGRWTITYRRNGSEEQTTKTFDAVMVCTGHHAEKHVARFPGTDKFRGRIVHSHDYKDSTGYEDKRVVVVGVGNSGVDVAVELSRVASQVYLSTRRGSWVLNRVAERGEPIDMLHSTRFKLYLKDTFPSIAEKLIEQRLNHRFDHNRYSLQPKHDVLAQHPTVNDELPNRIISGRVRVKTNIREFTENDVVFEDGTIEKDIDAVVLATGYKFGFNFIDKEVVDVKENRIELYKYMFPPEVEKNTMAVIGCFQPLGAIMPLSEMQCRLATRVFKGSVRLPDKAAMWSDIRQKEATMARQYVKSTRHTIQVDYIPFMDELAAMMGCKPDIKNLFLTDPRLAVECLFGPGTPYQYRLMGPGKWQGARKAIMTQWDRTFYPLGSRDTGLPKDSGFGWLYMVAVLVMAMFVYIMIG